MKYHVRRTDRQITEQAALERILSQGKYATLAFCRQGEPYLATLNYGYDSREGALYFHCAKEGLKTKFLRENPHVCATVVQDNGYVQNECEHHYASVVLRGQIEIVDGHAEKQKGLEVLIEHLEQQPETMKAKLRLPERQRRLDEDVDIWRLKIVEMTGKEHA
jgi:nitroimidazol reductase NimA-like FMN-containing flavoprotein (pyridoxamine 5'-phosphate oxidase superfamily)